MLVVDRDGRIVLVNEQTERLFGYSRDSLLGQSIDMLVPPRFRTAHPADRSHFFADPRSRPMGAGRELYGLRQDGVEVPVEIGLNPVTNEQGTWIIASVVDLSERRRAEQRFRLVVEAAPNAFVMVDRQGKMVLVNSQAETLFGYDRTEMLGQTVEMLVPERFRQRHPDFRSSFHEFAQARPMGAGRDLYGLRKDGREVPIEIGLNPLDTDEGRFVLAAIVDITERKRAHEEVEAFVYIVSHDLRAPLVNLQGFSRELAMSCDDLGRSLCDPPGEVRQILQQDIPDALRYISASIDKFERLINALLGLSRSGRQEYRCERLDMTALARKTVQALQAGLEDAEVAVAELPTAWGDPTAVGQVVSNLLANASHYRDRSRPSRIEVGGDGTGSYCHYWVRDNGVGVPAPARSRLFHVFQRFHPELASGEGMGLALIKRIVERHGGRVWVDTEVGVGSTFHFTLPATEREAHGELRDPAGR